VLIRSILPVVRLILQSLETPHLIPRDLAVEAFDLASLGESESTSLHAKEGGTDHLPLTSSTTSRHVLILHSVQSTDYTFALDPDQPPKWSIACLPKASLRKEKFAEEILIERLEARRPRRLFSSILLSSSRPRTDLVFLSLLSSSTYLLLLLCPRPMSIPRSGRSQSSPISSSSTTRPPTCSTDCLDEDGVGLGSSRSFA